MTGVQTCALPICDDALAQALLTLMAEQQADFTLTFRGLADAAGGDDAVRAQFADPAGFDAWAVRWRKLLPPGAAAAMRAVNPAVIPRNHRVEEAISAAVERDDFVPFEGLMAALATPFEARHGAERYTWPPGADERVVATFCGT